MLLYTYKELQKALLEAKHFITSSELHKGLLYQNPHGVEGVTALWERVW